MFIFKKIVSYFLFPVPLILIISFTGLFFLWFTRQQRTGKVLVTIGLFLLLLLSSSLISNQLLIPLESKYIPHSIQLLKQSYEPMDEHSIKFIVVLGGGHKSNPKLPITGQIDETSMVRLIEGIRLYRKYPDSKLILSGGKVFDPVPNAEIMANIAKELGIDEKDIIIEGKSRDTKDEAKLIKSIVNNDRFILVTSASHMPRSMAMFKKLGMNPIHAPTGHLVKDIKDSIPGSFCPNASNLCKSRTAFYEYLGIIWAKLRRLI